ncbi:MAG: tRNA 2-thiouridine(34) synthase MnmA [Flavobacteriaceae bacterium]|nr:tRNA 2-thiouridine(34) synthase MnmA [Flavobacteriaceae bacterium]|tara:strand:- start:3648 stop:4835 length:1188 start_codon:yes stop_codon:yes gene_type:complete
MSKKVVVALSGGVDSSVAALILKKQGYHVIGIFMKNWHDESVTISKECPWLEDSNDALIVSEKLGIPFQVIDLSKEYKKRIVDYMFREYKEGRTPNPDILCNKEIKFDIFLSKVESLGADYIATGHYCRKKESKKGNKNIYKLIEGKDKTKDQSYFLCQLNQVQLSKVLFPIGDLKKTDVRKIAKENGFVTANKKDSQGLCFVGKIKLPEFLQQKLKIKKGKIIKVPPDENIFKKVLKNSKDENFLKYSVEKFKYSESDGEMIGYHNGAHFFTIGQRKGLQIGGFKKPLFVIEKDIKKNIIYVGEGKNHPGLYRQGLLIRNDDINWVRPDLKISSNSSQKISARIRYRQPLKPAQIFKRKEGLYLIFDKKQKAISSGQFAAWYIGKELIGSGVIH